MEGKVVEIEGVEYMYVKTKHNNCFGCDFLYINKSCLKAKCGNNHVLREVVKMERQLGEVFECKGKKYVVQRSEAGCEGCEFDKDECNDLYEIRGSCCMRTDEVDAVFK